MVRVGMACALIGKLWTAKFFHQGERGARAEIEGQKAERSEDHSIWKAMGLAIFISEGASPATEIFSVFCCD